MDSLLANYASSDGEEEQPQQQQSTSSFITALPKPKTSSLFSSPPQPQINPITKIPIQPKPTSNSNNSSIFSSLPLPKSQNPQPPEKFTKRVVRIIPVIKSNNFDEDDEDEEEGKQRKKRKESQHLNQDCSVKSFLSSIPAPKSSATLGVFHSNQGSGRRSIVETEAPASSSSGFDAKNESSYEMGSDQQAIDYAVQYHNTENYASHEVGSDQNVVDYANHYQNEENYASPGVDSDKNVGNYENYVGYESGVDPYVHSADGSSYVNYGNYNDYGDYWQFESGQEIAGFRVSRKKGKNEIPTEVVEVKQDELMKDRPREDQVKLTGKAFGPSYQAVSTKGKPTKLHKRKHQISSLYFDMKQKEMELAERRARGLLTKAQTQGKYGW
ncbi:proline-rich protein PRCC-like [Mangifera indica]|uniref:proline-rich protein PRCC-like n=1 Tax=Mangifera indica TaxID=29780 RepID=UPI001CFC44A7|nr:proline-rich protein PRCC-like [Mangifera indica]